MPIWRTQIQSGRLLCPVPRSFGVGRGLGDSSASHSPSSALRLHQSAGCSTQAAQGAHPGTQRSLPTVLALLRSYLIGLEGHHAYACAIPIL